MVGIGLQYTCQSCSEASEVSTTLNGIDVVDVRVDVLAVVSIIHDGDLDRYALFFSLQVDDIIKEMSAVAIDVTDKLLQSVLCMEHLFTYLAVFVSTQVAQGNLDAGIEECQLTHTTSYDIPLIDGGGKYRWVWPELLACTALVGLTYNLYRI